MPPSSAPLAPPADPLGASADGGVAVADPPAAARAADYRELLKPGISAFVTLTAAAGYVLGTPRAFDPTVLLGLVIGTALTAGGAGALNHWLEREHDARMERTRRRPIAAGRVRPGVAALYGAVLIGLGVAALAFATNALTTGLAALTAALYLAVYTPLKRRTPHNTLVGAVPGALPALGGVTAATGEIGGLGLAVFGLLFLWQLPHFYSLAWMYRADYARGGFQMLPDEARVGGRRATAALTLASTLALLVVGLVPTALGAAGWLYLVGMAALGTAFTIPAFSFFAEPTDRRARRLLLASIAYVPVFFALVVADRLLR